MSKFIISIELQAGTRERVLARAPEVQAATRAEPGCLAYDFFTCTDDPDEAWRDKAVHDFHMAQEQSRRLIAYREQFHRSLSFETINRAS